MSRYECFDRSRISLAPIEQRGHDLTIENVLPLEPPTKPLDLPELQQLSERIITARENDRPVILMMGAHPIKLGLSRFLIDLIERDLVTLLATNGAGIIHDFELASIGGTSEPTCSMNRRRLDRSQFTSRCGKRLSMAGLLVSNGMSKSYERQRPKRPRIRTSKASQMVPAMR